jgi:uncharacterized beta-barrel protein YwiB (DUF1934 family)
VKEIMLTIIGRQIAGDEAEDRMEFVTEGKLYQRGEATYLIYDESEFSGFPGCKTSLRVKGDTMRMKRLGANVGYGLELEFQEGRRFVSSYETPYGEMDMEVFTTRVKNSLSEEGTGSVEVDYDVSIGGMAEGKNELRIEIRQ